MPSPPQGIPLQGIPTLHGTRMPDSVPQPQFPGPPQPPSCLPLTHSPGWRPPESLPDNHRLTRPWLTPHLVLLLPPPQPSHQAEAPPPLLDVFLSGDSHYFTCASPTIMREARNTVCLTHCCVLRTQNRVWFTGHASQVVGQGAGSRDRADRDRERKPYTNSGSLFCTAPPPCP